MMDISALLELITNATDKAELTCAVNAHVQAMSAVNKGGGKSAIEDLNAARALRDETAERLAGRYAPRLAPQVKAAAGERFKDRKQAWDWLRSEGYTVSKDKFYGDCANGKPRVHPDRGVSRYEVMEYANSLRGSQVISPNSGDRRENADTRKAEAEAEIKERQNERERRELDADWMRREEAEEVTCVWVSRLRDATAYHVGKQLLAIIHGCGGNPARLSEAQSILDAALAAAANEISQSGAITVEIE